MIAAGNWLKSGMVGQRLQIPDNPVDWRGKTILAASPVWTRLMEASTRPAMAALMFNILKGEITLGRKTLLECASGSEIEKCDDEDDARTVCVHSRCLYMNPSQ